MRKSARRKPARKQPSRRLLKLGLALLVAIATLLLVPPRGPDSFQTAKPLARDIHGEQGTTFYCGCSYRGNRVDQASCGYQPRRNRERAARIEWEHVVPAWEIGHQRACWKKGGRDYCGAHDAQFARAEADLHNLVPAIGEVNGDRSNFPFTERLAGTPRQYGQCAMRVDFKNRQAMPPEASRGAIARTYLYMDERYQLRLSRLDRQRYEAWHRRYPVSAAERQRNQAVACRMGWGNPWVGEVELWRCGLVRLGSTSSELFGIAGALAGEALNVALRR